MKYVGEKSVARALDAGREGGGLRSAVEDGVVLVGQMRLRIAKS